MSAPEERNVTLKERQWAYLDQIAQKYGLPDESKALRCLVDFAIEQTEHETSIFQEIRCFDC